MMEQILGWLTVVLVIVFFIWMFTSDMVAEFWKPPVNKKENK